MPKPLRVTSRPSELVLTVEDHYLHGGLGDAVMSALSFEGIRLHKMGIRDIAHSGKPAQLLDHYGISARAIIEKAKHLVE